MGQAKATCMKQYDISDCGHYLQNSTPQFFVFCWHKWYQLLCKLNLLFMIIVLTVSGQVFWVFFQSSL